MRTVTLTIQCLRPPTVVKVDFCKDLGVMFDRVISYSRCRPLLRILFHGIFTLAGPGYICKIKAITEPIIIFLGIVMSLASIANFQASPRL